MSAEFPGLRAQGPALLVVDDNHAHTLFDLLAYLFSMEKRLGLLAKNYVVFAFWRVRKNCILGMHCQPLNGSKSKGFTGFITQALLFFMCPYLRNNLSSTHYTNV